jgi:hypothetical protein
MPRATIQRLIWGACTARCGPLELARLDGVESPFAGVEIGDHTAPAAKPVLDRAAAFGMGIMAVGVGLPGLEQHILDRAAGAVDDHALDADALSLGIRAGDVPAQLLLVDVETGRAGGKADMDVRSGGLGRCFAQVISFCMSVPLQPVLEHGRPRPRSTMSNL